MRWISIIFFIILLGLIQNSFLRVTSIEGICPDLLFLFALYLGLYARREDMVVGSWLAGICKDLFSMGHIGIFAGLFLAFGLVLARLREEVFKDHPLTQIIIVFLAVLFLNIIFLIPLTIYFHLKNLPLLLTQTVFIALYTALLAPLCFPLFAKMRRLLGIKKG